jgi:TIR domain-containing protein
MCPMSLQIFISYKRGYREFALELKSRIHSWGYKSWLDVDEIPDGSYFRFEIDKGLKTSDVVVGVLTQEAQESREVLFELDFAIKKNKPLLHANQADYWAGW